MSNSIYHHRLNYLVLFEITCRELQVNLIRSHSSGIGDYLSTKYVRMLMALRINVLAKGYSGISVESLESVVKAFNKYDSRQK